MTGPSAQLPFDDLNAALKAAGEETRLRILALLAEAELTVSDLTDILRQSQPRISRHLKLLAEAGLVERFREGAWAFFRLAERGGSAELARELVARLDPADPTIAARPRAARRGARARARRRRRIISARHAAEWDRIRKLHVADDAVEAGDPRRRSPTSRSARCSISAPAPAACSNCSGPRSSAGSASTCRSTCCRSRARGSSAPACAIAACGRATSTICALPRDSFDVVIIHQVLHFLDDGARAIARGGARAARRPAGCWWSISRRTISNSCARSMRIAGSASPPRR